MLIAMPLRSRCPVACVLDLVGDRWSLLVIRDLMRGKRRYAEFLASPEGIPTNILADRLKRLKKAGVIASRRYSQHPPRVEYLLTGKGEDLRPIMRAMADWGVRHVEGAVMPGRETRETRETRENLKIKQEFRP